MQLLKACMYKDLDEMEALGAYEIAPEDFALTEFICVSKQPHQKIIREGGDLMREELDNPLRGYEDEDWGWTVSTGVI
jgi:Na+-transporting NADH:ubiquinone oxidoreductase subunit A